jgi:hypothetical protein
MSSTDITTPPPAPPDLAASVTFADGDSDTDKATKLRFQSSINNLRTDAYIQGCNVASETTKSIGVVT